MKAFTVSLCCAALPVFFSGCQKQQVSDQAAATSAESTRTDTDNKVELRQRGDEIADKLLQSLGSKLKAAMQAGGPEHALMVCKQVAQPSTVAVSSEFEGADIRRVSLKLRNPFNAPDAFDKQVLTDWERQLGSGSTTPESVVHARDDGRVVYYRPIMTQAVCLNCHGDPATFPAELTERLAELYLGDKATGYVIGQLRGAFRVEFSQGK